MSNPFAVVAGAKVTKTGSKFPQGTHLVKVQCCKLVDSAQHNTKYFIPECVLVESDNDSARVGGEYSDSYGLNHQMGPPNIKKFAAAVCGLDATEDDVEDKIAAYWSEVRDVQMDFPGVLQDWVSADNPLGVLEVELYLTATPRTSDEGRDYMRIAWHPRDTGE
jgi:hypothetical protein